MTSAQWTPSPDLDLETIIRQENDGTAKVYVILDGRVIAHLDIIPVPDADRHSLGYTTEVDAYAYLTGWHEGEVSPTRIHVHAFRQPITDAGEIIR